MKVERPSVNSQIAPSTTARWGVVSLLCVGGIVAGCGYNAAPVPAAAALPMAGLQPALALELCKLMPDQPLAKCLENSEVFDKTLLERFALVELGRVRYDGVAAKDCLGRKPKKARQIFPKPPSSAYLPPAAGPSHAQLGSKFHPSGQKPKHIADVASRWHLPLTSASRAADSAPESPTRARFPSRPSRSALSARAPTRNACADDASRNRL